MTCVVTSLFHYSRTNGKIERFHEMLRPCMNLLVYTSPDDLRRTMRHFLTITIIAAITKRSPMSTADGGKNLSQEG